MTTRDLALVTEVDDQNPILGDLAVGGTTLLEVEGAEAVAQEVSVVLNWWRNEWFLDQSRGVPYIEDILKRGTTEDMVKTILKAQLVQVPDLSRDLDIDVSIDGSTRHMTAEIDGKVVVEV